MSDQRARPGLTSSKLLEWYAASCGHTILVGYERLAVAVTHGNLQAGCQPSMAQAARCAFSDVDRTQPSVRIKGSASGKIRTHARRCRTRGLLQGPYRVADVFGQAFLPTSESSLNRSKFTDFDVDTQRSEKTSSLDESESVISQAILKYS